MTPQSMTEGETNSLAETIKHNAAWRVKDVQPGMVQIENRATGYGVQIYTRQQWEAIVKQTETGDIVNDFQDIAITLVARLDEQINALTAKVEAIMAEATNLESQQKVLQAKREAILNGADAATGLHIDSTSPYETPPKPAPAPARERIVRYNLLPGGLSQHDWVRQQLEMHKTVRVSELAREFAVLRARAGVPTSDRDAEKIIGTVLSQLIKLDPTVMRVERGVYKKVELTSEADGA